MTSYLKQKTLRLPFKLYEQVDNEAKIRGLSFNAMAIIIFRHYVNSCQFDR